jgi:hypothetical protein
MSALISTYKHSFTHLSKQQATEHQIKWVGLVFCVLEGLGSGVSLETSHTEESHDFHQSPRANARSMAQIQHDYFLSHTF